MSKENKGARKFDLVNRTLLGNTYLLGDEIGDDADNVIYGPTLTVIEYSAYQALQAELKKMRQQFVEREMEIKEFEGLREVSGENRVRARALEQRLAAVEKQLAIAVEALEEGWQLAQHYGEFESIEKIENALKQIEELSK